MLEQGLNFRTRKGQDDYFAAYDKSLGNWNVPFDEQYIETSFGKTHLLVCGHPQKPPLVLLHAASCGAVIWYKNVESLSKHFRVYAIDLITESSKSILRKKITSPSECAKWLNETFVGLSLKKINLCGLSIGGWQAINYAMYYPAKVHRLILFSPIQTFAKMNPAFFVKIMRMGFHPTRKNVEKYIGWGNSFEEPLPNSIIEQFIISVMNINKNSAFPKMIKQSALKNLQVPTLILFGEKEFAFPVKKAARVAGISVTNTTVKIIKNTSHLIPLSSPEVANKEILAFLK